MRKFITVFLAVLMVCLFLVPASAVGEQYQYGAFQVDSQFDFPHLPVFAIDQEIIPNYVAGVLTSDAYTAKQAEYDAIIDFFWRNLWYCHFETSTNRVTTYDAYPDSAAWSIESYEGDYWSTMRVSSSSDYVVRYNMLDTSKYISLPFIVQYRDGYSLCLIFWDDAQNYLSFYSVSQFYRYRVNLQGELQNGEVNPYPPVDPDDYGPAKVQWTSWGNKTTAPGEFIPMLYPVQTTFNLYTGSNEYHTYGMYCEAYDKEGNATGQIVHIPLPVGNEALPPNHTYQIYIRLNSHVSLKKGVRYAFTVYDKTTGDEISTIGVKCGKNIFKIPGIFNKKDSWSVVEGDAFSDIPLGDGIIGSDGTPKEGIGGTDINSPIPGSGGSASSEGSLLKKLDDFITSITQLPGYLARAIESLSIMGQQIGAFFGSFFAWMPSDMLAVFQLGIVLIVTLAVIKFVRG